LWRRKMDLIIICWPVASSIGYLHKIDREYYSRPGKSIAFALLRMFGVPVFVPDRLPILLSVRPGNA
jgi:hypothetical protein